MIIKRGKSYQVRVEPFKAQTVYSKAAAEKLERDLKNRKSLGQLFEADPTTLGAELDQHLDRRETTRTLKPRTVEFHHQSAKPWMPLCGMLVTHLTRVIVEDHFTARARTAPVAANNELKLVKACLREAVSRGQRVDPAIFEISPVQHRARRGRALDVEQLIEFASWFPEHVRRLITLGGLVGPRQAFWFGMTEDMLYLDDGTMLAPAELQKNNRDHRVYLTELEVSLFKEQLMARAPGTALVFPTVTGRAWTRHHFRKRIWLPAIAAAARADRERTGKPDSVFDGFTFHMLRHTAGSLMALSGMEPPVGAERLGHTDGGALFLKTYRHLYEGERRRHADRFGDFIRGELEPKTDDEQAEEAQG